MLQSPRALAPLNSSTSHRLSVRFSHLVQNRLHPFVTYITWTPVVNRISKFSLGQSNCFKLKDPSNEKIFVKQTCLIIIFLSKGLKEKV